MAAARDGSLLCVTALLSAANAAPEPTKPIAAIKAAKGSFFISISVKSIQEFNQTWTLACGFDGSCEKHQSRHRDLAWLKLSAQPANFLKATTSKRAFCTEYAEVEI
jgi:hypothetical protein